MNEWIVLRQIWQEHSHFMHSSSILSGQDFPKKERRWEFYAAIIEISGNSLINKNLHFRWRLEITNEWTSSNSFITGRFRQAEHHVHGSYSGKTGKSCNDTQHLGSTVGKIDTKLSYGDTLIEKMWALTCLKFSWSDWPESQVTYKVTLIGGLFSSKILL